MVCSNPSRFKKSPSKNKFEISDLTFQIVNPLQVHSAYLTERGNRLDTTSAWYKAAPASSIADGCGGCSRSGSFFFLLPVRDSRLNGVFGEDRTVNLHGRKAQLAHDVRVRDGERFLNRLALDPLGRERRAGNGRAAAEGLELGLFDDLRFGIDLHLQAHDVAAFGRANQACAHVRIFLGQAANIARMFVVIDYLIGISHFTLLRYLTNESLPTILFCL